MAAPPISLGCIGKGQFEIRLTEPVFSRSLPMFVNGLEELFQQTQRSTKEQLTF